MDNIVLVNTGELIYAAGEAADCAYVILSGSVQLRRSSEETSTLLTELQPGELFGEDGLISEKPRNTDAVAAAPTALRRIDGSSFSDTVRQDPESATLVLKVMLERLRGGKRLRPRAGRLGALIRPLTPEAEAALGASERRIEALPCRIGRLGPDQLRQNEIDLQDRHPHQISRSHLILCEEGGKLVVYDRGSSLGTWVRGQCLGGPSSFDGPVILAKEPTEVVLGSSHSPMRFQLMAVQLASQA